MSGPCDILVRGVARGPGSAPPPTQPHLGRGAQVCRLDPAGVEAAVALVGGAAVIGGGSFLIVQTSSASTRPRGGAFAPSSPRRLARDIPFWLRRLAAAQPPGGVRGLRRRNMAGPAGFPPGTRALMAWLDTVGRLTTGDLVRGPSGRIPPSSWHARGQRRVAGQSGPCPACRPRQVSPDIEHGRGLKMVDRFPSCWHWCRVSPTSNTVAVARRLIED